MTLNSITSVQVVFAATSTGKTITLAGKTFGVNGITFNGVGGGWTLADAFEIGTGLSGLILTNGALDTAGQAIGARKFTSNNSNTRTLTLGASVITLSPQGAGTIWDFGTTTGLTFNANSSTIKLASSASTGNPQTFSGCGLTYSNLYFNRGASDVSNTITGSNTFASVKDDGTVAHSLLFADASTTTLTTAAGWQVSGTAGQLISINSVTTATHALSCASGDISADYLTVQHSIAGGGASWYAGANSTDNQATADAGSGWIFTAPGVGGGGANSGFFLLFPS